MLFLHNQVKSRNLSRRSNSNSLKKQQGVVIVVALFIVALVATISYLMMARAARDIERTALLLRSTQAEFYAQGSLFWAMNELSQNWEQKKPNQIIDKIPIHLLPSTINGFTITTTIYDLQAKFNINNLSDPKTQINFISLLQATNPTLSNEVAQQIILAIVDWISPVAQDNEFSKTYSQLTIPYRSAHRPMVTASELQLVKGITTEIYQAIKPYIIALPETTLINIQTAEAPVLMTLSPNMTLESAQSIAQLRLQVGLTSPQIFAGLDVVKNHQIPTDKITVSSSYFLVETKVSLENEHALLYTLLQRTTSDNKARVYIVWQSKSVWN